MSEAVSKVLLATDRSVEARRATRMAEVISGKLGAELHVVYVEPVPEPYAWPESAVYDASFQRELRERAEQSARARLGEELEKLRSENDKVTEAHAEIGRPDAEIVRLAEDIGADIVVLGSRGIGPLRRVVMGSVSTSVVRHAHGSVLVVRDGEADDYLPGRILLAIDGSQEASAAAKTAVEIANKTDSELHVLFSFDTAENAPYSHPLMGERWAANLEQAKHDSRQFVEDQAKKIEAMGGKVKDAHLTFGKPDEEIVKLGEELEAGLIVVGSRGLGGVRRMLLGSVSDSVVSHAHGPVLVVRSNEG